MSSEPKADPTVNRKRECIRQLEEELQRLTVVLSAIKPYSPESPDSATEVTLANDSEITPTTSSTLSITDNVFLSGLESDTHFLPIDAAYPDPGSLEVRDERRSRSRDGGSASCGNRASKLKNEAEAARLREFRKKRKAYIQELEEKMQQFEQVKAENEVLRDYILGLQKRLIDSIEAEREIPVLEGGGEEEDIEMYWAGI